MTRSRHRRLRPAVPALPRSHRSTRFALTFLAFAGLVGPAWALREQAVPFFGDRGKALAITAPDASLPQVVSERPWTVADCAAPQSVDVAAGGGRVHLEAQ